LYSMRKRIIIEVTPADRARSQSIVRDRNSAQKHVWPGFRGMSAN
jgi:hypothetical protein